MDVTPLTWIVASSGLVLIGLLAGLQLVAVLRPRSQWTIDNVAGSVPFWYSAVPIFLWDRDLGFCESTATYWVITWGMWPAFGVLEGVYCFIRLLD